MVRDPRYAPPTTEVADPPLVAALPARPRQVLVAVALLWLSLALGIPEAALSNLPIVGGSADVALVLIMLLLFGLIGFLNLEIYQGRNWARIVMLALTVSSVVMMLFSPDEVRAEGPLLQGFYLFDTLIEVAAMYLVFSKPGSLWFRRPE